MPTIVQSDDSLKSWALLHAAAYFTTFQSSDKIKSTLYNGIKMEKNHIDDDIKLIK